MQVSEVSPLADQRERLCHDDREQADANAPQDGSGMPACDAQQAQMLLCCSPTEACCTPAGRSAKQQQQQQQSASQPAARRPMLPAPRPKNSSSRTVMAMKRLMAPPQPSASWQAPALSQARPSSRSSSPAAPRQSPTPTTASKPAEQRSGPQKATKQKRPATADSGRRGKRGLVVEKAADPGCARARPYQRQRRAGDAQRPSLPHRTAVSQPCPVQPFAGMQTAMAAMAALSVCHVHKLWKPAALKA